MEWEHSKFMIKMLSGNKQKTRIISLFGYGCLSEWIGIKNQFGPSSAGFGYVKNSRHRLLAQKIWLFPKSWCPKKHVKHSGSGQLCGCPKLRANLSWKEVGEPSDHLMPRSRFLEASWGGFWGGFLDQQNTYSVASKMIFIYYFCTQGPKSTVLHLWNFMASEKIHVPFGIASWQSDLRFVECAGK